jgi:hypothetical protein
MAANNTGRPLCVAAGVHGSPSDGRSAAAAASEREQVEAAAASVGRRVPRTPTSVADYPLEVGLDLRPNGPTDNVAELPTVYVTAVEMDAADAA